MLDGIATERYCARGCLQRHSRETNSRHMIKLEAPLSFDRRVKVFGIVSTDCWICVASSWWDRGKTISATSFACVSPIHAGTMKDQFAVSFSFSWCSSRCDIDSLQYAQNGHKCKVRCHHKSLTNMRLQYGCEATNAGIRRMPYEHPHVSTGIQES